MVREDLAQADKGPHDRDVDLNGPMAPQDTREHGHALLGEGVGKVAPQVLPGRYRILRYHDCHLLVSELKHEIFREAVLIAPDLFPKADRLNPIELRQVAVEHDLLSANQEDSPLDTFKGNELLRAGLWFSLRHGGQG